ncbi:MFS transporter [Streptomyces sp. NPDC057199]|uniref:MFS transporter n=1 Tax=Streptomyces sp. NPDC057199 TaxID=3346047 RepID=UPI0036336BE6
MSVVDQVPPTDSDGSPPPLRRNRDFRLLWSGAAASFLSSRVSAAAYPLIVLWHTNSPLATSLVSFAALLPLLLIQLPAGALVDRWDRRRLMIVCEAGRFAALATVAVVLVGGTVSVPLLAAVAFVESSLNVFYRLAERGAVRNVVPAAQLPVALAGNEARGRAAGLVGQPGGILLHSLVRWAPFLFAAVGYLVSLGSLLLIRKDFQAQRAARPGRLRAEVAEGMRWLWKQRFLRVALGIVAGSNVLFQVLSLALILMIKEEGRSPATLSVVVVLSGIGGMLGALTGGWWLRRLSQRTILVGGATAWAALMTSMALVRDPFALGALFAGTSLVGAVFNVASGVYQVRVTPDGMQGRVAATANLIGSGTNALGSLGGGLVLAAWGTTRSVLLVGGVMAVLAALAALSPALRTEDAPDEATRADDDRPPTTPEVPERPEGAAS